MTVLAGRYELGDELGAGGMGRVVAAHDRVLDRPVAVKLLGPGADAVSRKRFLREARAAARLGHPGAVAVHDTGEDGDRAFIVMELVSGESLAALLDRHGRLDVAEAVAVTVGVLEVLTQAHAAGMVHRDVKPANVLLPDGGGVKLADFGLAKALDETTGRVTTAGQVVGTPAYLAPELVDGADPSPASDVYSVGCLLHALLTGRPPFTADSPLAVAYAHRHEPVPEVGAVRADVPDDVQAVLEQALAKEPAARFADAGAMKAALLGEPVTDSPPTAVVAAPEAVEETAPVDGVAAVDAPAGGRRGWWLPVGLIVVALPLALAAWALGGGTESEQTDPDAPAPADGGTESEQTDPDAPAPADEDEATAEDEAPGDLPALISVLADAPPGTYGEKHDDLLEDLIEVTREQDRQERAEEAADLRQDVGDWVGGGELDPEVGGWAADLLAEETSER